jgi:hypothetical protein
MDQQKNFIESLVQLTDNPTLTELLQVQKSTFDELDTTTRSLEAFNLFSEKRFKENMKTVEESMVLLRQSRKDLEYCVGVIA